MEFTKGKWTVPFRTRRDGDNRCWVMRGKTSICRCFGKPKTAEANAKELVRRWNGFEELLAACELGLEIANYFNGIGNAPKGLARDVKILEVAIKQATS